MSRLGLATAALLALGACAPTPATVSRPSGGGPVAFTVPVTDEFSQATLNLTGGVAPAYVARWKVLRNNGRIFLCGAGVSEGGLLGVGTRTALRASTLEVNGALVMSDIRYFSDAPVGTPLLQATANCADAGPEPAGNFNAVLRIGGAG